MSRTKPKVYQCAWFVVLGVLAANLLFLLLSLGLRHVRYSKFYEPKKAEKIQKEHDQRLSEARTFFEELSVSYDPKEELYFPDRKVEACIAIASTDRSQHRYLTITLASVLKGISKEERRKYNIKIFVIDTEGSDPSKNREAKELTGKYPNLFTVISAHTPPESYADWHEKETLDYVFALRTCKTVKPKMAIILEDDVMATNHFVSKFFDHLYRIPEGANYMDIKLFYPDYYCGFSGVYEHILVVLASILLSIIPTMILWKCLIGTPFKTKFMFSLLYCYFIGIFVAVPLLIGKQNLMSCWEVGVHPFPATAFTNAVAYHYTKLDFLATALESQYRLDAVDLLLDNIAKDYGYERYLIVPNLFQHIGIFSSSSIKNQGNDAALKMSNNFVSDY